MSIRRVALLTAGGFAPCLSAAVGDLIERYTQVAPEVEIIAYQYGYHGLLTGNYIVIDDEARKNAGILRDFGGSPIGNSRVKLTNAKNLVERGLVEEGVNPLEFAAEQLRKRGYQVHVYDRYDRMGGLLIYGIPNFKLEKNVVERRSALLADGGVSVNRT